MADHVDLATLLVQVIEANREAINEESARHDGNIAVELHYHPTMNKVEPVIRPSRRLPPFKVQPKAA